MSGDQEQRVRRRAYQIWDQAGQPEGCRGEHWHQAVAVIDVEDGQTGSPPMPASTWAPDTSDQRDEGRTEGDRNMVHEDDSGQFAGTQHGRDNDGVTSAEPRIFSGEEGEDAKFFLRQNTRKKK